MSEIETSTQDYRGASKRCYLYAKENIDEEIPAELVDYTKGAKVIILEEFFKTLHSLPDIYFIPIKVLERVLFAFSFVVE